MKFVIENVKLIGGEKPTVMISWSSGTTDFYPWHSYPLLPDLTEFKPWFYRNTPGLTLFRAPATIPISEIEMHNIRHYQRDPEQPAISSLIPRLEKAAEEIEEVSKQHCLYPIKQKRVINTDDPLEVIAESTEVDGTLHFAEHTDEDDQDTLIPRSVAFT